MFIDQIYSKIDIFEKMYLELKEKESKIENFIESIFKLIENYKIVIDNEEITPTFNYAFYENTKHLVNNTLYKVNVSFIEEIEELFEKNTKFNHFYYNKLIQNIKFLKENEDKLASIIENISSSPQERNLDYLFANLDLTDDIAENSNDNLNILKKAIYTLLMVMIIVLIVIEFITIRFTSFFKRGKFIYLLSHFTWLTTGLTALLVLIFIMFFYSIGISLINYRGTEYLPMLVEKMNWTSVGSGFKDIPDCMKHYNKTSILMKYDYNNNKEIINAWEETFTILFNMGRTIDNNNYGSLEFLNIINDYTSIIIEPYKSMNEKYNNIVSKKFIELESISDAMGILSYFHKLNCTDKVYLEFHFKPQNCKYSLVSNYKNTDDLLDPGSCLLLDQISTTQMSEIMNEKFLCYSNNKEVKDKALDLHRELLNYYNAFRVYRNTLFNNGLDPLISMYVKEYYNLVSSTFENTFNYITDLALNHLHLNFHSLINYDRIDVFDQIYNEIKNNTEPKFSIISYYDCSYTDRIISSNSLNFLILELLDSLYSLIVNLIFIFIFLLISTIFGLILALNHIKKYSDFSQFEIKNEEQDLLKDGLDKLKKEN